MTDITYHVCDSCAVVLANADTSHIEDQDTIERLDSWGMVFPSGAYDNGGYWECDGCLETVIGTGHVYENDNV